MLDYKGTNLQLLAAPVYALTSYCIVPVLGEQQVCFGLPVLVLVVKCDTIWHSILDVKLTDL